MDWGNQDLLSKFSADGHLRAADGAEKIPAIGELAELHLLAKSKIAQALTSRPFEALDAHITMRSNLVERHRSLRGGDSGHRGESELIEMRLQ